MSAKNQGECKEHYRDNGFKEKNGDDHELHAPPERFFVPAAFSQKRADPALVGKVSEKHRWGQEEQHESHSCEG